VEGFMEVFDKMDLITTMNFTKFSPAGEAGGGL
jgi:hypothetical protein